MFALRDVTTHAMLGHNSLHNNWNSGLVGLQRIAEENLIWKTKCTYIVIDTEHDVNRPGEDTPSAGPAIH